MKTELITAMNGYLANVGVLYVKLHNLHWNVVGSSFKHVHEYLETLYDGFADVLDATAEALKMQGAMPLASMKSYLAVATITELPEAEISTKEALAITAADLAIVKAQAEAIRKLAAEEDDYAIVSMMEGDLANLNKTLWFLAAMAK